MAPLLSMVIVSGTPCSSMARSKKRRAAARVSVSPKQKVDRGTGTVDGSVQVLALAGDFDAGLVHPPAHVHRALAPAKHCRPHRQDLDRPPMDGGVIDGHAALVLHLIWANNVTVSLLICARQVAFFPILSNTTLGLHSADHNLVNLFQLYRASRWQTLRDLRLPAAMPYFPDGLRISGGLSLIGAVVAEFVAGTGGTESGLAYRILESGYQLKIPRTFAALTLVSLCSVAIFVGLSLLSHFSLRHWHDSAVRREN